MKFSKPHKNTAKLDITPLIDIIFLLVIFFMLASTFAEDIALNVAVGSDKGNVIEQLDTQTTTVEIHPDYVQIEGLQIGLKALQARLRKTPDNLYILKATNSINVQRLTEVIDFMRINGVVNIKLEKAG